MHNFLSSNFEEGEIYKSHPLHFMLKYYFQLFNI